MIKIIRGRLFYIIISIAAVVLIAAVFTLVIKPGRSAGPSAKHGRIAHNLTERPSSRDDRESGKEDEGPGAVNRGPEQDGGMKVAGDGHRTRQQTESRGESDEQDRSMTVLSGKDMKPEPKSERTDDAGKDYSMLDISRDRMAALLSDSGHGRYRASDYEIGELLDRRSGFGEAVEAIDTLTSCLGTGEYPEGLFADSMAFYLKEKISIELSHGIVPDTAYAGWPLVNTETQINIPVRFVKNRKYAAGEIIFEKQGAKWYIIEIAVDFSILNEDRPDAKYDDFLRNE